MAQESIHKKLGRVRPPRVHITYEVHTGGAMEKRELPFVVGVLADLSGKPAKPLPKLKDRKFVNIDRDEFDTVMGKQQPRLQLRVKNTLQDDNTDLSTELNFRKLADFQPENVARQVPALNQLLELRAKLSNLRSTLYGNDKLEELLREVVNQTAGPAALAEESK